MPADGLRIGGRAAAVGGIGEMEHHELIHLLDEVDDERARARFREAIYISLIIWLVIGLVGGVSGCDTCRIRRESSRRMRSMAIRADRMR